MPRRRRLRRVVSPPGFRGYRPYGISGSPGGKVDLYYEEYEAIKLIDYDNMNHQEAAEVMGVSRATVARIYKTARRKIAESLVERKEIVAAFGHAVFDDMWYVCNDCNTRFTLPEGSKYQTCGVCKSENIRKIQSTQ